MQLLLCIIKTASILLGAFCYIFPFLLSKRGFGERLSQSQDQNTTLLCENIQDKHNLTETKVKILIKKILHIQVKHQRLVTVLQKINIGAKTHFPLPQNALAAELIF